MTFMHNDWTICVNSLKTPAKNFKSVLFSYFWNALNSLYMIYNGSHFTCKRY